MNDELFQKIDHAVEQLLEYVWENKLHTLEQDKKQFIERFQKLNLQTDDEDGTIKITKRSTQIIQIIQCIEILSQ
ncbi:hypothetical protein pb186bvf_014107 [Paramecium bursaria]